MTHGQPLRIPDGNASFRVCQTALPYHETNRTNQKLTSCQTFGVCYEGLNCKSVFIRIDSVKRPLTHPYEGPFQIIERHEKYLNIYMNGEKRRISIEHIKPACICENDSNEDDERIKVTPSGHCVRFLA